MVGSVAMLLAFLAIFLAHAASFDFIDAGGAGRATGDSVRRWPRSLGWQRWTGGSLAMLVFFGGVFLGFAVKVPLMPFHTWLPATYAEAPTGVDHAADRA